MKRSDHDLNYVPKSAEDLYRHYFSIRNGHSHVKNFIRRYVKYATDDEMETLLHDVFVQCLSKTILEKFDPKKANFGGLLFTYARSICVNFLAKKSRNPLTGLYAGRLVLETQEGDRFEAHSYSLDRYFGTTDPAGLDHQHDRVKMVARVRELAQSRAREGKSVRDKNLTRLVELLATEHEPREIGRQLGVTTSTVHNWISYLRANV